MKKKYSCKQNEGYNTLWKRETAGDAEDGLSGIGQHSARRGAALL